MVVDERNEVPADFTAVQRTAALRFEPVEKGLWSLVAFDHHFAPEGDHIRFFTDAALRQLLLSNGFEVERIRHIGRFAPLWAGVFVWARKR